MNELRKNLEELRQNKFKLKTHCTKHRQEFIMNEFIRPVTMKDFFYYLAKNDTKMDMWAIHNISTYFAKDYDDYNRLVIKITKNNCVICNNRGIGENIDIDKSTIDEIFRWFRDEKMFTTDFRKKDE